MFERYNEGARRTIFFARHEASHRGLGEITPADIALGVAREAKNPDWTFAPLTGRWEEMVDLLTSGPRRSDVGDCDLPLSNASKRVLAYASEESQRDGVHEIGPEHLLRGVLREGDIAARKLAAAGLDLPQLRQGTFGEISRRGHLQSRIRRLRSKRMIWLGVALLVAGAIFYLHLQQ